MTQTERRRYERLDVRVRVDLSVYDSAKGKAVLQSAQSRNASAGGLLVTVQDPLEISSFVLASFTLPGKAEPKQAIARVVRVDEVDSPRQYDIGLEFVETALAEDAILAT